MSVRPDIRIFEVGPRDGLQNEKVIVSLKDKVELIQGLIEAGVQELEVGAFVRADRVPQMADTAHIFKKIRNGTLPLIGSKAKARAWALVPNRRGLQDALMAGAKNIAVFTAATDSFAMRNIGMTVQESLREFRPLIAEAKANGLQVRGYVSTAMGCPFEGAVSPKKALKVIEKLAALGVFQVSIGDTIGVATPRAVEKLIAPALGILGKAGTAVHFHDTRGMALANTLRALDLGVTQVDSSAGGLGGCPFAPSATGNLATEDLIYMLDGMGLRSGIQLEKLAQVSLKLAKKMKRPLSSRYLQAFAARAVHS